jgi:hypothetical protein
MKLGSRSAESLAVLDCGLQEWRFNLRNGVVLLLVAADLERGKLLEHFAEGQRHFLPGRGRSLENLRHLFVQARQRNCRSTIRHSLLDLSRAQRNEARRVNAVDVD